MGADVRDAGHRLRLLSCRCWSRLTVHCHATAAAIDRHRRHSLIGAHALLLRLRLTLTIGIAHSARSTGSLLLLLLLHVIELLRLLLHGLLQLGDGLDHIGVLETHIPAAHLTQMLIPVLRLHRSARQRADDALGMVQPMQCVDEIRIRSS